jgi:hypothetical protein
LPETAAAPRRWPLSAIVTARIDKGEQQMPEPPATVTASFLPDGRYRLQIDGYIPVGF